MEQLYENINGMLNISFTYHFNYNYWEEFDEIDRESEIELEGAIDGAFNQIMTQYMYSENVQQALEECRVSLHNVLWAAMNLPFPRNAELYVNRLLGNVHEIFWTVYAPAIQEEIRAHTKYIRRIQKTWKKCVSDPNHPVCRRRLEREFRDLTS